MAETWSIQVAPVGCFVDGQTHALVPEGLLFRSTWIFMVCGTLTDDPA